MIGYSPIITFNVPSYDMVMDKLKNYEDIEFDGSPVDTDMGKVCIQ